jgi:predicted CopG family antitoxin
MSLTTNVQVSDEVREQMEKLKKRWRLRSYNEVIKRMVRTRTGRPESLFGAAKGSRPFRRDAEHKHGFIRD